MSVELIVPQLGESITEAVVGKWHKKVGEAVSADEPVVVLETDKVTIDVQAPAAGALGNITHKEGDKVKIGDVLGLIEPGQAGARAPEVKPLAAPAAAARAREGRLRRPRPHPRGARRRRRQGPRRGRPPGQRRQRPGDEGRRAQGRGPGHRPGPRARKARRAAHHPARTAPPAPAPRSGCA